MHMMNTASDWEKTICEKCGSSIPYAKSIYGINRMILCIHCFHDFNEIMKQCVKEKIDIYLKDSVYKNPHLVSVNRNDETDDQ